MARVLRHAPEDAGLTLTPQGWAPVSGLIKGMRAAGLRITRAELEEIVATNDKARFEISPDGSRIRAVQGHSVDVDPDLQQLVPPDVLYHGTASHSIGPIMKEGLISGKRRHVHLSADLDTAFRVGSRHGNPVCFEVDARGAHEEGVRFFLAKNGVWLSDAVPAGHLVLIGGPVTPEPQT